MGTLWQPCIHMQNGLVPLLFCLHKQNKSTAGTLLSCQLFPSFPHLLFPLFFGPSSVPFVSAAANSLVSQLSLSVPPAVDPAVWARWAHFFAHTLPIGAEGGGVCV